MSGATAKLFTLPFDTLKKRRQVAQFAWETTVAEQSRKHVRDQTEHRKIIASSNLWKTCMYVMRTEGFVGFFRGATPSILKSGLGSGCTFMFYDVFLRLSKRFSSNSS
jgi:Mitochondrial carrier protein